MGRKGECGGTAGGGRSGRRGNITYSRVIPKFLRKLTDPESLSNPLDAKRPWATGHLKAQKPRDGETEKNPTCSRDAAPESQIEILEAQGFNVIAEGKADTQRGKQKKGTDTDYRDMKATRGSENKLQVVGGIEKKPKRVHNSTVGKAFNMKNRQKLSFFESDSEDE